MGLPKVLRKLTDKEEKEPKLFLALVLTEEVVQAAVWRVKSGITEVVAQGLGVEWDGETRASSELITAVDATIASATEGISEEIEQVILGVPYSWTDQSGIVGSKRELIKKINQELELSPLGYVSLTDSVLAQLKLQEGAPTSAILIQISKEELTVVLVRLGRVEGVTVVKRKDDIAETVVEAITQLRSSDNLPSRIVLFNNMYNLDEIAQELMQIPWQKHFEFLHLPKIETLPKDIAIRSLALAGGSEVAKALGFVIEERGKQEIGIRNQEEGNREEFLSEEEIGFGIEIPESTVKVEKPKVAWKMPKFSMSKRKLPSLPAGRWGIIGAVILILLVGVVGAWWMIPQATVTVVVAPKWIDREVALTLVTDSTAEVTNLSVPASLETISVSGEKTIDTTGTKTIGEKARGEVVIYNRTSLNKTFAKKTVLTAAGGIKFSLDEDVSIASKSAGVDYVDVPGKATAKISANAIGTESNLGANTELTIASFDKSSYVAKNESAFTGGTSQKIQVVAKSDLQLLSSELTNELTEQLKTNSSAYLIPSSIAIKNIEYSAKEGEEAKTVNLNMTLTAKLLSYKNEDVRSLIQKQIAGAITPGYMMAEVPIQVEIEAEKIDENESTVTGTAKVKIGLQPTYNEGELIKIVAGKTKAELTPIIQNQIAGTSLIDLNLGPAWWLNKSQKLPRNSQRIKIVLRSSEI